MASLAVVVVMGAAGFGQASAAPVLLALAALTAARWWGRLAALRAERAAPLGSKIVTYVMVTMLFDIGAGLAAFVAGRWLARFVGT